MKSKPRASRAKAVGAAKNNSNPRKRREARATLEVKPKVMAGWPLLAIVADGMKASGTYSPRTLSVSRVAIHAYEKFVGHVHSAIHVTDEQLDAFRDWLVDQGYELTTVENYVDGVATVVRFADAGLLPGRSTPTEEAIFSHVWVEGSIERAMVKEFFLARGQSEKTRRHYGFAAKKYAAFLDRVAMLEDLTDDNVERWIGSMKAAGMQPATVHGYVVNLLAFWKWAAARRLVDREPTIAHGINPKDRAPLARSPAGEGSIVRFTERYVSCRDVSPVYAATLRRRAMRLARFAGTEGMDRIFSEEIVNKFLASLTLSPYTVRSYRSDILSIWNAAADEDRVSYPVLRRIRNPKCSELAIECYTVDEVRKLLVAAAKLRGAFRNGVAKRLYWTAAIMVGWDTGLRRGDLWNLRTSAIRKDGTAKVVQHKTGQVVTVRLRESSIRSLMPFTSDQALSWPMDPSYFGRHFKSLMRSSGVGRGSFKWLRRSSGSYVELQLPGSGTKHLGHRSPQVFDRHYDAKLGGHAGPQPPDLEAGKEGGAA